MVTTQLPAFLRLTCTMCAGNGPPRTNHPGAAVYSKCIVLVLGVLGRVFDCAAGGFDVFTHAFNGVAGSGRRGQHEHDGGKGDLHLISPLVPSADSPTVSLNAAPMAMFPQPAAIGF